MVTYDDMSVRSHKNESREMLYVCTSGVSRTKRCHHGGHHGGGHQGGHHGGHHDWHCVGIVLLIYDVSLTLT